MSMKRHKNRYGVGGKQEVESSKQERRGKLESGSRKERGSKKQEVDGSSRYEVGENRTFCQASFT